MPTAEVQRLSGGEMARVFCRIHAKPYTYRTAMHKSPETSLQPLRGRMDRVRLEGRPAIVPCRLTLRPLRQLADHLRRASLAQVLCADRTAAGARLVRLGNRWRAIVRHGVRVAPEQRREARRRPALPLAPSLANDRAERVAPSGHAQAESLRQSAAHHESSTTWLHERWNMPPKERFNEIVANKYSRAGDEQTPWHTEKN